jgi:hypothetical protein
LLALLCQHHPKPDSLGERGARGQGGTGSPEGSHQGETTKPGLTTFLLASSLSLFSAGSFSLSFMVCCSDFGFLAVPEKEEKGRHHQTVAGERSKSQERPQVTFESTALGDIR